MHNRAEEEDYFYLLLPPPSSSSSSYNVYICLMMLCMGRENLRESSCFTDTYVD